MNTTTQKPISEKKVKELLKELTSKHYLLFDGIISEVVSLRHTWIDEARETGGAFYQDEFMQITKVELKSKKNAFKISPQQYQNHNNVTPGKEGSNVLKFEDLKPEYFDQLVTKVTSLINEKTFTSSLDENKAIKNNSLVFTNSIGAMYAEPGTLFLLSA